MIDCELDFKKYLKLCFRLREMSEDKFFVVLYLNAEQYE